jgi:hypothetical protein
MNSYIWKIKSIQCRPLIDGRQDVVSFVSWELTATSDQTKQVQGENSMIDMPYSATTKNEVLINYEKIDNFVPYEQLTEAQVIEWLIESLGDEKISNIKKQLDEEIFVDIDSQTVSKPLPWLTALKIGE